MQICGKVSIELKPASEYLYEEATYKKIYADSLFFLNRAKEPSVKEEDKDRYARVSILLMAFYLESLSNALFKQFDARSEKKLYGTNFSARGKLPEPIQNFLAVYRKLCQKDLSLSTDFIDDIFTIRNKILAHPLGFSVIAGTGIPRGQGCYDKKIKYKKFTNFPYVYSLFKTSHAETVVNEVRKFMNDYCNLLKNKVPKPKIFDAIRPT